MIHISHFREAELISTFSSLSSKSLIPNFIMPSKWQCHKMLAEKRACPYGLNLSTLPVCPCVCPSVPADLIVGYQPDRGFQAFLLAQGPGGSSEQVCSLICLVLTSGNAMLLPVQWILYRLLKCPDNSNILTHPDLALLLTAQVSQKKLESCF